MNPAEKIIEELGGLTETARALSSQDRSFPVSTVQGWKNRGKIPTDYWVSLIEAGKRIGKEFQFSDFVIVEAAQ